MAWFYFVLLMSMLPVYRTLHGCSPFRQSAIFFHKIKTKAAALRQISNPFKPLSLSYSLRLSMSTSTSQSSFSTQTKTSSSSSSNRVNTNSINMKKIRENGISLALNILVDPRIRSYLKMKGHERKSRALLPAEMKEEIITNQYIRELIEKKLISLYNQPYILRIHVPGTTISPKQFTNDKDLFDVFVMAQMNGLPSVQVYIDIVPGIFPPTTLNYLKEMNDPLETDQYTLLSFYTFNHIKHPEDTIAELRELWKPFNTVGRVYVASEGVNAQMAIPTNVLPNFAQACKSYALLSDVKLNPDHEMTREEFELNKPFKALHIRYREQIVADGFGTTNNNNNNSNDNNNSDNDITTANQNNMDDNNTNNKSSSSSTIQFDWNKAGREMPPLEWHQQLDNPNAVVLDCRNSYESDVGRFDNAIPLNTTFFRESWQVLDEILENTPKDAPIMTYCTGGIRCVKINAYLEQKLGFQNVARLQGGIVSYTRELALHNNASSSSSGSGSGRSVEDGMMEGNTQDSVEDQSVTFVTPSSSSSSSSGNKRRNVSESKFRGVNYVFDERMSSAVTAEVLAQCDTCGDASDKFTNCNSDHCHIRFIQCDACRSRYGGCCSAYCQLTCNNPTNGAASSTMTLKTSSGGGGGVTNTNKSMNKNMIARVRPINLSVTTGLTPKPIKQSSSSSSSSGSINNSDLLDSNATIITPILPSPTSPIITSQNDAMNVYCDRQSVSEPLLLSQLRQATENAYIGSEGALRMLCSTSQGRFFTLLTQITNTRNVLELGTFTGYSALCFAEGIANNIATSSTYTSNTISSTTTSSSGSSTSDSSSGSSHNHNNNNNNQYGVVTCDIDDMAISLATKFIRQSEYSQLIDIRQASGDTVIDSFMLQEQGNPIQKNHVTTANTNPNPSSSSSSSSRVFDMIFIDADKKQYQNYIQKLLFQKLLKPGGLILIDNTLWKGLVLHQESDLKSYADDYADYGKKERMIKLTEVMHEFNVFLKNHTQLQPLLLPMRDGLTLVRYSP